MHQKNGKYTRNSAAIHQDCVVFCNKLLIVVRPKDSCSTNKKRGQAGTLNGVPNTLINIGKQRLCFCEFYYQTKGWSYMGH